jgi:hypothetical protein
VRAIATLIIIVITLLPSLYAGWPGFAPDWFDERHWGVPASVIAMVALMAFTVLMAGVCSLIAGSRSAAGKDAG